MPSLDPSAHLDHSLTCLDAKRAVELDLAEADWHQTPLPRAARNEMRRVLP